MRMNPDEFAVAPRPSDIPISRLRDQKRNAYLSAAADAASDAVIGTDLDGRIALWSGGAERCFGYTPAEALGLHASMLAPPGEAVEFERMLVDVRSGGRVRRYETAWLSRTGRRVEVEVTAAPAYGECGQMLGVSIVARDISERRRAEQQLLHAERVESLGQIAGGVAHDFNNLATAIIGYAELGLAQLGTETTAREDFVHVRETAERAACLAQRLLAYARRRPIQPEAVDVNLVIDGARDLLSRLAGGRTELCVRIAPQPLPARIDASELEQVVVNLVLNARDALSADGGAIRVETSLSVLNDEVVVDDDTVLPRGEYVTLTVADNGHGIDSAVKHRIFEPFFTTRCEDGGTGIGLASCRRIARRAGGGVSVESTAGQGAAFRVLIPRCA